MTRMAPRRMERAKARMTEERKVVPLPGVGVGAGAGLEVLLLPLARVGIGAGAGLDVLLPMLLPPPGPLLAFPGLAMVALPMRLAAELAAAPETGPSRALAEVGEGEEGVGAEGLVKAGEEAPAALPTAPL